MDKAKVLALIAALYLLEIKERSDHIKATAKDSGVDAGDLFKALKEAGYNPKAEKGSAAPTGENTQDSGTDATTENVAQAGVNAEASATPEQNKEEDGEKITVTLRHKTEYPAYRRAGLVLKQTPGEFRVTAEQLAILQKDKWVEIRKGDEAK